MQKITIVGRANVGKSTLFNRLLGRKTTVTAFEEGTTRDSISHPAIIEGKNVILTDTAGLLDKAEDELTKDVQNKLKKTLDESEVFIFVVDGRENAKILDIKMAKRILSYNIPVILALNKVDHNTVKINPIWENWLIKNPIKVSAINGYNFMELTEKIDEYLKDNFKSSVQLKHKIIVLGRPNVGKSSLINALNNDDRLVVSSQLGTTRDVIPVKIIKSNLNITALDTPGIRKRGKIEVGVEKFGNEQTKKALIDTDLAIIVLDSAEGATRQDIHIIEMANQLKKPLLLVFNKLDLVENTIGQRFAYINKYPHIFLSAKTGENLDILKQKIEEIIQNLR